MVLFVKKHYGKNPSVFNVMLKIAIATRGGLSFMGQLIPVSRRSTRPDKIINALLVGEPADTKSAAAILISDPLAKRKIAETSRLTAAKDRIDEITFCLGKLSYSDVFRSIQQMVNKKCILRFSAAGSGSIVSSMSKRNSGEILVRRETDGKGKSGSEWAKKKKGPE